ncbi:MAG: EFR1 family ferrodoxin [Bacillota bacterium]|nr:EFR1 family ferrodoxin [Bacillota bacterium]
MYKEMDVYYFSGTGNTKFIMDKVVQTLEEKGARINSYPIEKGYIEKKDKDIPLILAFPVNSQSISPFIWKFLKRLPRTGGKRVYALVTLNDSSGIIKPLGKLLENKGYDPAGVCEISLPNNMLVKPADESQDSERLVKGIEKALKFADIIAEGKNAGWIQEYKGSGFVSFLSRYTGLTWFSMRALLKLKTDNELCKHCGLCVKQCPVGNIREADYMRHGNRCEFCMRCAANCPEKAIFIKGKKSISIRKSIGL